MTEPLILVDNPDYVAVSKPAGWLSQASTTEKDNHLLAWCESHLSRKLHLLTRLDRPVSGICLLSKTQAFTRHYIHLQNTGAVTKKYIALVEGHYDQSGAVLKHSGKHDKKKRRMLIVDPSVKGSVALNSDIRKRAELDRYTALEISIASGRFHQIRSQLAAIGHPIKGDVKYGARRANKDRFIYLHAWQVLFSSMEGRDLVLTCELPKNDHLWSVVQDKI